MGPCEDDRYLDGGRRSVNVQFSSGFITSANIGEDWFNGRLLPTTLCLVGQTLYSARGFTDAYLREPDTLLETVMNARWVQTHFDVAIYLWKV